MDTERIKVWDLPTRIFHWLLAALVLAAVITGKLGGNAIDYHATIGLTLFALLIFRIVWGFIGSTYARFAAFFPTPSLVMAYLRGQWQGIGHNPLGALSVFGLLGLLALQTVSGLFANDDIAFRGPLSDCIGKEMSDIFSAYHRTIIYALIALIALHLCAILFYTLVKKDVLIRPMITGWKNVSRGKGASATGGGVLAFIVAILIALAGTYAVSVSCPSPSAPPAYTAPTW